MDNHLVLVELSESLKDFYPAGDSSANITSQGYYKLNSVAGLSILSPSSLMIGTELTSNPHVEFYDDKTRSINYVAVRKIVYGRGGPSGSLTAIDKTMFLSLNSYLVHDLHTKVQSFKGCGGMGTETRMPEIFKKIGSMVSFPVEGSPMHLWVDFTHQEIQEVMFNHTKRIKFAERIATSIVERNCLRAHPAIGVTTVEMKAGFAMVYVSSYRNEVTMGELERVVDTIEAGGIPEGVAVEASSGDVAMDEVSDETVVAGDEHGEAEPQQEIAPADKSVDQDPEWEAALDLITEMKKKMTPIKFYRVLKDTNVTDLYQMETPALGELLKRLKEAHKNDKA